MNTANGTQMKIIGIQSVRESKQWARLFISGDRDLPKQPCNENLL